MRSRTELVTTTFVDSEEEQTESDDSEEDWRPESNRNGKKRPIKNKRRNKRKAATAPKLTVKRKLIEEDSSESDYQKVFPPFNAPQVIEQKPAVRKSSTEKNNPDKSGVFNLYLYKKDLDKDYKRNSHLCLWRRDGSSLLQKYIRVKTNNCEEFIFTSSSVYSSWDVRRRKDFASINVKCMEENNRRVIIQDVNVLHTLAEEMIKNQTTKTEGRKTEEESSKESECDDDEDEMSGDEDNNSAKSSEGDDDYDEGEEGSTNEGTSNT